MALWVSGNKGNGIAYLYAQYPFAHERFFFILVLLEKVKYILYEILYVHIIHEI